MWKNRLFLSLLFFVLSQGIFAQNDTIKLSQVVVSSVPNPGAFKQTARSIQVISANSIRQAPAISIDEILEQVAGIDLRQRGVFGMQADLNIRGGSFDQGLILINGIAVNDPQSGHLSFDMALDMDNIAKIEIIDGPASRWFGANAFSGGNNIITKAEKNSGLQIGLTGGQYGLMGFSVAGNYRTGKIRQRTSFHLLRSDGYQRDTDFKDRSLSHTAQYTNKNSKASLQLSYRDKAFGAYDFYTTKYPDQFEESKTLFSSLSFETGKTIRLQGSASWRRHYDRFELFREGRNWYNKQGSWYIMGADSAGFQTPGGLYPYAGPNFHRTDVIDLNSDLHFQSKWGKSAVGLKIRNEQIVSNVLGEPMADTIFSTVERGGFYNRHKSRNNLNLFFNQLYTQNRFTLSLGLNAFYNPDYGLFFNPGLDAAYFVSPKLKSFISVNRGMRLPTFTDLYYQGPDHISNPALKPEVVSEMETGLKYFHKNLIVSASVFYRIGTNLIDWVRSNPQDKWESKNLTDLHTKGISLSLVYSSTEKSSGILRSIRVNYTYLKSDKINDNFFSLYALDYLQHHFNLFVNQKLFKNLSAGWNFSYQKRNGTYFDSQKMAEVAYKNIFLLNAKITYRQPAFQVYIQATNLLNRPYHDIGSVTLPGLWVLGGVQFHLPFKKQS